jgi:hypothetical protein
MRGPANESKDLPGGGGGRGALIGALLACAVVAALALGSGWLDLGERSVASPAPPLPESRDAPPRLDAESPTDPRAATAAAAESPDRPTELRDGALPPLIGDPREDDTHYCDESLWTNVAPIIRHVQIDEVVVDEVAWRRHGTSAQTGIASWISKCRLSGEPVTLIGDESGDELGFYSADAGLRVGE